MYRHISRNQSDLVVPCPQMSRIHLFAASEIICAFWAGLIPAMLQDSLNFIAVMPVMSQMSRIPQQRAVIFKSACLHGLAEAFLLVVAGFSVSLYILPTATGT